MPGIAQVKFTRALVEEVAARVAQYTREAFEMNHSGDDIGHGTRYFDAHTDTVWHGPKGARRACAYYIGGALGWARVESHGPIPEDDAVFFRRVQAAYGSAGTRADRADYDGWETQGRERARGLSGE